MTPSVPSPLNGGSNFPPGGGEMGAHIRSLDWSKTAVGPIEKWPQSLRTILSVIINSKFPMFLYWGPEYTCFYNDAFRPSLGNEGKHPASLGKPGWEFWAEAWHEVESSIYRVKAGGEAVWSEDQLVPIYRNGKMENVYWTYSFSPVHDESGTPGGVLVTIIESTQKVLALAQLEESADDLSFAIEATELATFDVNPLTIKLKGNRRLKEWFGLGADEEVDLQTAVDVIAEEDKARVLSAIERAYEYASGGGYNIEYTIVNPATKQERYVKAKGRAWFNEDKEAYRFNGTLQDITPAALARRQLEESESRFRSMVEQVPVAIGFTRGKDHVFQDINPSMLRIMGRRHKDEAIGKKLVEVMPELKDQVMMKLLQDVLERGMPYMGSEMPAHVNVQGRLELGYYNISYTPLLEEGVVNGIIHAAMDVTEQVLARKQVEESEQQVRSMLEAAPFPIAVYVGQEMKVQSANQAVLDAWGKGNKVIGRKLADILPELESQQIFKLLDQVYTTGIAYSEKNQRVELVVNDKLQTFYFNNNFTPLFDEAGKVYGIMNTAANVTDLVLAQQNLKESEQRFRLFVQASNDTLYRMSADWQQMLTLEGKDFLSITDKPNKTWVDDYLPPADQERALETIKEAMRTKSVFELEHRVITADGNVGWTFSRAIPVLDQAGEIIEWFGAATDITEQKLAQDALEESEQRFRIMADAAPNIIWALNPDTSIKYANKFLLEFIDTSMDKFLVSNWDSIVHPEDLKLTQQKVEAAFRERKMYRMEQRLLRHDGAYRWMLSQGAPSYFADGDLYGYVGSSIDITEIKQAELKLQNLAVELAAANEELRASSKQVQEANDMLSDSNRKLSHTNADLDNFIYTASHDLRAPISNIEALMHAILEDLSIESRENPAVEKLFKLMGASIERFKRTVNDLTEITKLQRQEADEGDVQVALSQVIREVQLDLNPQIEQAGAEIQVDIQVCRLIDFSSKNARSVVYNLVSNALKYRSPERQLLIQIDCYLQDNYQVLSVQDNGLGMDLTDNSKVFGMFKRLHDHVEGTGVGLYIVKKIVENAGGKIEVESKVNEGTIFRVFFRDSGIPKPDHGN
ncbi:PAS domain-containing sensor histidine kinase [Pontibacter pamirensis]|uniref:PAS domain-containing sensor histidine kinase n=1 Tax=Pontibacter pamirensis TaxID=2562824 RepID=UPI001389A0FC|nr:PAS domain-containing sensor histidine kinase [Pontibacter pamirensis]